MKRKVFPILIILSIIIFMPGCNAVHNAKIKFGLRNEGFEYIKEGKVNKVIIQNTRDKNFKFIITDSTVIEDLYDILSKGKLVEEKSTLKPDYVIEIFEKGVKTHEFSYIAGLDKNDNGNLYSEDEIYLISNRLDNDLIRNFFNVRKPINFYSAYYGCITSVIDKFIKQNSYENINIDMKNDKEAARFILSTELRDFKQIIKENYDNIVVDEDSLQDIRMNLQTEGYNSTMFKIKIEFKRADEKIATYYVIREYKDLNWNIDIYENKKPKEF